MGATFLALIAIAVWSTFAFLSSYLGAVPPFLSAGLALSVGGLVGLITVKEWRIPLRTFAVGVGGVFGYHALLFAAFRSAPYVEANLINYLWPLLIVVLSPLYLRGFRLSLRHVAGALLGLAGALLIVTGGRIALDAAHVGGYLLAAAAALVWASYSLLTKRLPLFSSGAVGGFCLASGALSLGLYCLGRWMAPGAPRPALRPQDWLILIIIGVGPMGAAFYAWDAALKRGDPRVIGALSYLTPLLSTLILVVLGGKRLSATAAAAMALIVAGAVVGSWDLLRPALMRAVRSERKA